MAASPAQGQEDVAAAARPAVGRRSLDDLPPDPRRPHAIARHGDEARPWTARAPRGRRYAAVPRPGDLRRDEPDGARRVRPPRRRDAQRAPGPPDHGVLPGRSDASLRSRLPAVRPADAHQPPERAIPRPLPALRRRASRGRRRPGLLDDERPPDGPAAPPPPSTVGPRPPHSPGLDPDRPPPPGLGDSE